MVKKLSLSSKIKKNMRNYILFLLVSISLTIQAQYQQHLFQFPIESIVNVESIQEDWAPSLQNMEMPKPGTNGIRAELMKMKEENEKRFPRKNINSIKRSGINPPGVMRNFIGNPYNNRVPNDNDLAISNAGQLISVINSTIYIYDVNADSILRTFTLDAFAQPLGLPHSKYDPKVVYDPLADKFVMVFLNGFLDSTSRIIVAFSQTNDAAGNWNVYALPGNPLNNSTWSDYPVIGISTHELFIGINTFTNGSSNNSGFTESCFWQIKLADGYNGNPLTTAYYNNLKPAPTQYDAIFNICPVKGGSTSYGPDMYLLSNRNLMAESDTFYVIHVSDTLPNALISMDTVIAAVKYFMPPTARQANGHTFDTNDSRILGAFIENDTIQFVQSCLDTASGNAAVYHGFITNLNGTKQINALILADTLDLGYPNISYAGNGSGDNRAIINVNHSSATTFSGWSAYNYDGNGNYSLRKQVKAGNTYVNILSGIYERWGDYTGSQRKYNEPGVVWAVGSYGNLVGATNRRNATWIAELTLSGASLSVKNKSFSNKLELYPNPTSDMIHTQFNIDKSNYLQFNIYDMNGKIVKQLMREYVKEGQNKFSFSIASLASGVYIFKIENENKLIFQQKFIKQ
jgi:hypothetical protein